MIDARSALPSFSDGSLLGAGYGTATVWNTSAWQPELSLAAPVAGDPRRFGVQSIAFSPDRQRMIVAYATLAPQKTPPVLGYNIHDGSIAWTYNLRTSIGGNDLEPQWATPR